MRPGHGERHPLTEAQAEKWLGSRYSDGAALAFGEGFELAFDGDLDVEALSAAFAAVTERHEALSMRFEADGSAQVYEPPSGIGLRYIDLRNDREPRAAYAAFCVERTGEPFDPAAPPLVRAWLCRLGAAQWRLLLRAHHLVFDGWSLRIVLQDLAAHYNKLRVGAGSVPAVDSWIDYVRAERERRDGESGRVSLAYWLDKYRDLPEPLRLPTDRARARRLSFAADTIEHAVPDELWSQLRTVARTQGVTRFSLLLAGYVLLLHRLTGQCDLVCGIPFAGAARGGGARVVGDTDNTLPLRIRIVPEEPLSSFVQRVHDAMREAALHQDVSLGRIVRALPLVREPGRLMLVDSILTLNPAIERLRFDGVACRMRVMPHRAAAWELAWQWRPLAGGMVLEVQYHSDLYLPATIRAWCDAYLGLLKQIARGDDIRVDDAGAAEGVALVDDRRRDWDDNASLPDLLQDALSRYSGRRAACCAGREIDYAALDRASRVAASALRARGVVAGQLVGICMARSVDMLVAVLAVLRSGAAYVPLDPSFPPERLRWMAGHARLGVIIADDARRLPQGLAHMAEVMRFVDVATDDGRDAALPKVAADDLAYVLYTSGSTGEPKGVRILHRNLVNFLRAMREAPGFDAGDVLCAATTLSFDIAALELYLPLLCGGCIVIADDRQHRDPDALARLIEHHGCTVLQTTPSLLALLLEVKRDHVLRPLKLLVGGEALPPTLARALLPRCRELWNLYGPTETTVWSTIARVVAVEDTVPLGAPIADTRVYLLDARGRPSLPGAIGEIWIGGAGVADGYLHRPDLTAERFVDDVFAADGSRMYRTGDLGRIRDGKLYFHGRVDEQIKLRGYRIEPAEIEAAAAGEAGVIECVAVARDVGNGDQVLVLYAGSDAAPDDLAARLRQRCARLLPGYMRPQHVVVLKALPKTPNGKIDRRALPAPDPVLLDFGRSGRKAADAATPSEEDPRDALQTGLRDAWRRLLRRPDVGVHDNFFELGGYSLLAVRLFAELHERHGVDLPLSTLIERPTIAGLADALRDAMRDRDARQSLSRSGALVPPANDDAELQSPVAADSTLVELRAGGELPPLFLAHAVGGNVLNYLPIASAAAPGRAVYGLQSPGLDGAEAPLVTIEAMAARYARAIRGRQPHGPYLLAGGSMGGVLALEIARLLRQDGDEIAFLGMFDTWRPGAPGWAGESPWRPHRWWSLYRGLDAGQRAALWRRIGVRLWQLPVLQLREWLGRGTTQELRRHRVESSNQNALAAYRPRPYAGRIVLFRAMQAGGGDATLGWSGFADGVDVIELGGRHDTILEQPELPLRVRECIAALRPDFDRTTMNTEDHPDVHLRPGIDALRAAAAP